MGIGPVNRVSLSAPAESAAGRADSGVMLREVVAAIRGLNASEMLGNRRELQSRRNRSGRFVIEVVDRETGEILGELPPEEVLHLADEMQRERRKEDR